MSADEDLLADHAGDIAGGMRPSARRRTVTASAWVPALPPMPAMIGIHTASATVRWIMP